MTAIDLGGSADERTLLTGFLDWYRAVAEHKVADLPLESAVRPSAPSGLTPLGIVKHLTWVERGWFELLFAGRDIDLFAGDDNAPSFRVDPADTVAGVVAAYRAATDQARAITAAASLDDVAAVEHRLFGPVTLRWILVHMLEETARHAGHLDLLREAIDGRTGD